jgi:hypothetical protein
MKVRNKTIRIFRRSILYRNILHDNPYRFFAINENHRRNCSHINHKSKRLPYHSFYEKSAIEVNTKTYSKIGIKKRGGFRVR